MTPGNKRRSLVWNHFTKDGASGKCHYCSKYVSMSAGSSGNLNRHLKLKHPDVADLGLVNFLKLEGDNCEVVGVLDKNEEESAENVDKLESPDYEVVIEGIENNDEVEYQVTKIIPTGSKSPPPTSNPEAGPKSKLGKRKISLVKRGDIKLIKTKNDANAKLPYIENHSKSDDVVKTYYEQKIKSAEAKALFYQSMVDHIAKKTQFDQQTHLNILRTLASLNSAAEATVRAMNKLTNSFTVQREES